MQEKDTSWAYVQGDRLNWSDLGFGYLFSDERHRFRCVLAFFPEGKIDLCVVFPRGECTCIISRGVCVCVCTRAPGLVCCIRLFFF